MHNKHYHGLTTYSPSQVLFYTWWRHFDEKHIRFKQVMCPTHSWISESLVLCIVTLICDKRILSVSLWTSWLDFLWCWCCPGTSTWVFRGKDWPSALWLRSCCTTRPVCASTTPWIAPTQTPPSNLFYDRLHDHVLSAALALHVSVSNNLSWAELYKWNTVDGMYIMFNMSAKI